MKIVKAQKKHLTDILSVESDAFEHPWTRESVLEELEHPDSAVFIAFDKNTPVGYIMLRLCVDSIELMRIAVVKTARNSGIASALIQHGETRCFSINSCDLFLEVDESNAAAVHVYEKNGFTKFNVRKNYYGDRSALCMKKRNSHDNKKSGISEKRDGS